MEIIHKPTRYTTAAGLDPPREDLDYLAKTKTTQHNYTNESEF